MVWLWAIVLSVERFTCETLPLCACAIFRYVSMSLLAGFFCRSTLGDCLEKEEKKSHHNGRRCGQAKLALVVWQYDDWALYRAGFGHATSEANRRGLRVGSIEGKFQSIMTRTPTFLRSTIPQTRNHEQFPAASITKRHRLNDLPIPPESCSPWLGYLFTLCVRGRKPPIPRTSVLWQSGVDYCCSTSH